MSPHPPQIWINFSMGYLLALVESNRENRHNGRHVLVNGVGEMLPIFLTFWLRMWMELAAGVVVRIVY
jgi:hypothetical protein